jgi:hypothetical protein
VILPQAGSPPQEPAAGAPASPPQTAPTGAGMGAKVPPVVVGATSGALSDLAAAVSAKGPSPGPLPRPAGASLPPPVRPFTGIGSTLLTRGGGTAAIFFGILMVLTFILPWIVVTSPLDGRTQVKMSWDILHGIGQGASAFGSRGPLTLVAPWFIINWLVGGGAAIATPALRLRRIRGTVQIVLGGAAVLLTIVLLLWMFFEAIRIGRPTPTDAAGSLGQVGLGGSAWLALTAMLVGCHIRRRFPESRGASLLSAIAGGILTAAIATSMAISLVEFARSPGTSRGMPEGMMALLVLFGLANLMFLVAGVLALVSGASGRASLSVAALGLSYGALGTTAAAVVGLPLTMPYGGAMALMCIHMMILLSGGFVILGCGGVLLGTALLAEKQQRESAFGGPAPTPGAWTPAPGKMWRS